MSSSAVPNKKRPGSWGQAGWRLKEKGRRAAVRPELSEKQQGRRQLIPRTREGETGRAYVIFLGRGTEKTIGGSTGFVYNSK